MRILLVEDQSDFAAAVEREVAAVPDCELVWVASRDGALARLQQNEEFDLIVLDRRIPSADGVLDDHFEHGWSVFHAVREKSAGTPVWFLTGTVDPDFAAVLTNEYARMEDLNGSQKPEAMYRVFWKRRISDCVRDLRRFAEQRSELDRIAIVSEPAELQLDAEEARAVRLFGRRYRGAVVSVRSLNGGLSNSRVLRLHVRSADGRTLITAAAKVASLAETAAEAERYRAEISRLRPGGFPQLTEKIAAGAGDIGGLFYGMVGDSVESLFDRLASGSSETAQTPGQLQAILRPWYEAKRLITVKVAQVRRRFVGDTKLPALRPFLDGINTVDIEACDVQVAECCQHGDLHCANVVFDERGLPMLIDFGDTGSSFAATDPVTLELSTVFHSQRSRLPPGWPGADALESWDDLSVYTEGCPYGGFVSACRAWAIAEAASNDELVAVAYGYAMRQLKYPDTDKQLARALIRCAVRYFADRLGGPSAA